MTLPFPSLTKLFCQEKYKVHNITVVRIAEFINTVVGRRKTTKAEAAVVMKLDVEVTQYLSVLHSHWSRNVEARLSLVESFIVLLRQLSYAIKNQLGHPKPPTRGFGTKYLHWHWGVRFNQ